jgi:hypothetical protein
VELDPEFLKPIISGINVGEFLIESTGQFIIFPYDIVNGNAVLVSRPSIRKRAPKTYKYLVGHENALRGRERGKCDDDDWHRFGRSQNIARQHFPKLCIPRLVTKLEVASDRTGLFVLDNVDVCGLTFKPAFSALNLDYLMGYMNSKPARWFFPHVSAPFQNNYYSANKQFVSQLPVPLPAVGDKAAVRRYETVAHLAKEIAGYEGALKGAHQQRNKNALILLIDQAKSEIDVAIAELLGLPDNSLSAI